MTTARPTAVIILAAGEGTRMKSTTPKVLHRIGGRSLLGHALVAARGTGAESVVVVVRHDRDRVAAHATEVDAAAIIADQDEIKGTGRAAECGLQGLPDGQTGTVLITSGDTPLLTSETITALFAAHADSASAVTVLTARVPNATGYGRILRGPDGSVLGIVEHKDATDEQRGVDEINSGIWAFDAEVLRAALDQVGTDNSQGEKYLTDVLAIARDGGHRVGAHLIDDVWQTEGINDRVQLAALGRELNLRHNEKWMREGVTIVDPATTWIDADVTIGRDATILPNTQLLGATSIGAGARIGPDTTLTDTEVGEGAEVKRTEANLAKIGAEATVGPFSYLRPGTVLGVKGKIGGFVETKNATIGDGAKVPHLTYAGDATIGEGANIGAGTIFANYDGVAKHHTSIGKHSFIGSDTVLIAPVDVADGAYVAAGSALTGDVKPGQIAVARGRQKNVDGWVARARAGTKTEAAAQAATEASTRHTQASDSATTDQEEA